MLISRLLLALLLPALVIACASRGARINASVLDAPNIVPISGTIVTSGQPTAESLGKLASGGFHAVIYLAPLTVADAVPAEAEIVRGQGMEFINIPIPFNNPTAADFEVFVAAMNRLSGQNVLVHCQVNLRASTMTFLYRVIARHVPADEAYDSVAQVWSPQGPWKALIVSELGKAGVAFEPY